MLVNEIMDPAWFYSTLAQVTAAIVGFAGGFLATRAVEHLNSLKGESRQISRELEDVFVSLMRGDTLDAFESELNDTFASWPRDIQIETPDIKPAIRELTSLVRGPIRIVRPLAYAEPMENVLETIHRLVFLLRFMPRESVFWGVAMRLVEIDYKVSLLRDRLVSKMMVVMLGVIILLIPFGIVWPLSVLPGLPNSAYSKGYMIVAFLGTLTLLLGVLAYVLLVEVPRVGRFSDERLFVTRSTRRKG